MSLTQIKNRTPRISRNPASKPVYQRRILEALARGMSPASAAKAAGVGRSTAYLWRREDRSSRRSGTRQSPWELTVSRTRRIGGRLRVVTSY